MKIQYYAETDSIYLEIKAGDGVETREIASGVNIDLDANGEIIGFDIDGASHKLDLTTLQHFEISDVDLKTGTFVDTDLTSRFGLSDKNVLPGARHSVADKADNSK